MGEVARFGLDRGGGGVEGPIRGWGGGGSKVWIRQLMLGWWGCKPRIKGIDKCK